VLFEVYLQQQLTGAMVPHLRGPLARAARRYVPQLEMFLEG